MMLKDKVAIVTGASKGIGRATAIALAKEGAKLVINYLTSEKEASKVVKKIENLGSKAIAVKTDVANENELKKLIDKTLKEFGRIDILVNNAGVIVRPADYKNITEESWNRTLDVNLKSVHNCIRLVAPIMLKQKSGKIVNMTTTYAITGAVGVSAYTAAKAGVISLTKAFAKELAPYVNVNAVAPGNINTDMTRSAGKKFIEKTIEETPLKRLGEAKEVANAIVFLVSPKADFITGAVLVVDGGHSLR